MTRWVLIVEQFAKLSSHFSDLFSVSLLVPAQLPLLSTLLSGHVFGSIKWLLPLQKDHRVKSPTHKTTHIEG